MPFFAAFRSKGAGVLVGVSIFFSLYPTPARADDPADAKTLTEKLNRLMDAEDADGVYQMVGEQMKRTASKQEILAGLHRWLEVKGGKASTRELVVSRVVTEDEARAMWPTATARGSVYFFRYRSKYPKGTFFEDMYVSRDSDNVLRINGHVPQPAE